MKKILSILAAVGLTATASTAVVACGSSQNDFKAETITLSGDKLGTDTTADGKQADYYISKEKMINALSEPTARAVFKALYGDKTKLTTKTYKDYLLAQAKASTFDYTALTKFKITKDNQTKNQKELIADGEITTKQYTPWNTILPNGTTYQIGFENITNKGDIETGSAPTYWVNLTFAKTINK